MNVPACMTFSKKEPGGYNVVFCVLAAFFPLGSSIGVLIAWGVFPIIAILLTLSYSRSILKEGLFVFIFFVVLLLFNYLVTIQYIDYTVRVNKNICLALIGCLYFVICFYSKSFSLSKLNSAIDIALKINITLFILQFCLYYAGGYYLDYSYLSGGDGARNFSGDLFRASGIFSEPAEYCSAMICLVSIKYLIEKKLSRFSCVILITVMLSFSVVGLIQTVSLFLIINFTRVCRRPLYLFILFMVFCAAVYIFKDYLIERYDLFILGNDGSNNTKIETISFFINNPSYLYGGAGLMGYDLYSMPLFFQGLYDLTYWGANVTIFGLFIGFIINFLFLFFLLRNFGLKEICVIFVCLIKINVMIYASYWFFIFSLLVLAKNKKLTS